MTVLYFVRHGETDYSGKIISGNLPGIHLNNRGKQQSAGITKYFESTALQAIYCSPLERAIETASPLAEQKKLTLEKVPFLREIDFGDFQGKGEELAQSSLWQRFLINPAWVRFPNGETVKEAQKRVVEGINTLCAQFSSGEAILYIVRRSLRNHSVGGCLRFENALGCLHENHHRYWIHFQNHLE